MKKISIYILFILTINIYAQTVTTTYNFESLVVGNIAGQDNWYYSGNLNTSTNIPGSAGCAIPSGAAPTQIATTTTVGLYMGGKALRNPGNTGGTHGYASRKNNGAWSYSIPAATNYLLFEFDYDNTNWWGVNVNLAYDLNNDGNYNATCNTNDANELGLGLIIGTNNITLNTANGSAILATGARPSTTGGIWHRYRIIIDLAANSGAGAGYVCYRNLNSSGSWTPIAALQNINMNINSASINQNNLQNLNGIVVQQEAGGVGVIDNISVVTINGSTPTCSTILPIELLNFDAECKNKNIYLNWTTASETNNDYFEIYRSIDAENYTRIAQIKGHGTTSYTNHYTFIDDKAPSGLIYYQLKQIDFNRKNQFYNPIYINNSCASVTNNWFNISPNPSNGNSIQLKYSVLMSEALKIKLINMLGQVVFENPIHLSPENNSINIELSQIPAGAYFFNIESNQFKTKNIKLIVE
jgi:hypothetical protein